MAYATVFFFTLLCWPGAQRNRQTVSHPYLLVLNGALPGKARPVLRRQAFVLGAIGIFGRKFFPPRAYFSLDVAEIGGLALRL